MGRVGKDRALGYMLPAEANAGMVGRIMIVYVRQQSSLIQWRPILLWEAPSVNPLVQVAS